MGALLLTAALLSAGPAQALSLDTLLRMPLERLLQLQISTVATPATRRVHGDPSGHPPGGADRVPGSAPLLWGGFHVG